MNRILIVLLALIFVSCSDGDNEDAPDLEPFCSFENSEIYDIGVDVTSDFNQTSVSRDDTYANDDCPGTRTPGTGTIISRVQRTGTALVITENEGTSDEIVMNFVISGTTLNEQSASATLNGCQITTTFNGTIDTTNDEITVTSLNQYNGDCEQFFPGT